MKQTFKEGQILNCKSIEMLKSLACDLTCLKYFLRPSCNRLKLYDVLQNVGHRAHYHINNLWIEHNELENSRNFPTLMLMYTQHAARCSSHPQNNLIGPLFYISQWEHKRSSEAPWPKTSVWCFCTQTKNKKNSTDEAQERAVCERPLRAVSQNARTGGRKHIHSLYGTLKEHRHALDLNILQHAHSHRDASGEYKELWHLSENIGMPGLMQMNTEPVGRQSHMQSRFAFHVTGTFTEPIMEI